MLSGKCMAGNWTVKSLQSTGLSRKGQATTPAMGLTEGKMQEMVREVVEITETVIEAGTNLYLGIPIVSNVDALAILHVNAPPALAVGVVEKDSLHTLGLVGVTDLRIGLMEEEEGMGTGSDWMLGRVGMEVGTGT